MLTSGALFAGIGGIEYGLEMAIPDFHTVFQVERDPYARAVLAKHWPDALRLEDVRAVNRFTVPRVDLISGGFPCQPHSIAGKRGGANDERDLWPEFARIISELEPRWVVAENVPGLLSNDAGRFFGGVLRDLARLGYDAEWHRFPASAVGAQHERQRVFIVAYPNGEGLSGRVHERRHKTQHAYVAHGGADVAHALRSGRQEQHTSAQPGWAEQYSGRSDTPDWAGGEWKQPDPVTFSVVRGMADGLPGRVDRLKTLGNAVVPQAAQVIGRAIREAEKWRQMTGTLPPQIVRPEHLRAPYVGAIL